MRIHALISVFTVFSIALRVLAASFTCDLTQGGGAVVAPKALNIGDTVVVSLPDGISFSLVISATPPAGIAGPSFIARDAASGASAVIKPLSGGGMRISIDDFAHVRAFGIRIKSGHASFTMRDTSTAPVDSCATCNEGLPAPPTDVPATKAPTAKLRLAAGTPFPLAEHPAMIDVLVAFDRGAKVWAENSANWNGGETIEEFADYAVAKMNTILQNSQLSDKLSFRLVGIAEVDAAYSTIDTTLLNALRLRNSGPLAPLAEARERCGADMITLLVNRTTGTTSGIGYEFKPQWTFSSFDSIGYTCSVCDIKTVFERYTMCHEMGHNLGCGHSNRQGDNSGPGYYSYSCGYHFDGANGSKLYTVMGYSYTADDNATYTPVPYYSSPNITPPEIGVPVGTVESNDNRRTILDNYIGASQWRENVAPYEWDVRFLDDNGNDIHVDTCFSGTLYVTITNANPNATIYYTYDGSSPDPDSFTCRNGQRFTIYDTKTITACAVVDGVAQSVRTATFTYADVRFGDDTERNQAWPRGAAATGNGTNYCRSVAAANTLTWTSPSWLGTLVFADLPADDSTKNFQFENYGNANSKILLRNCKIYYLKSNNATFPGTLILDEDGALQFGDNGYSSNYNVFGALEGNGSISASSNHKQAYVFNVATNYAGSIAIGGQNNGRRIVFGTADNLPSQAASITVQSGASASIGGSATWTAFNGIDIAGTLIVKGANSRLDCNATAAMGLKLADGAAFHFDTADAKLTLAKTTSFPSGTVRISFGTGVSPSGEKMLVLWPDGSPAPAGTFAFANASLAANWDLCKTAGGLVTKPKDRFDMPDTEAYIAHDSTLDDWLDEQNFWMYEENNPGATWQDFLFENGENGYVNWMNYALGLTTTDAHAKVQATISFDEQGRMVVSVADALSNAPALPGLKIACTLLATDDLSQWPDSQEIDMNGTTTTLPVSSAPHRFYKVRITLTPL